MVLSRDAVGYLNLNLSFHLISSVADCLMGFRLVNLITFRTWFQILNDLSEFRRQITESVVYWALDEGTGAHNTDNNRRFRYSASLEYPDGNRH